MTLNKLKKDKDFRERIITLINLRLALSSCIFINENSIEKSAIDIPLTKLGEKLFHQLLKKHNTTHPNIIKLALFIDFYHADFYLKVSETNILNIEKLITKWIVDESIRYPWVYGRDLYDKYFENFQSQESELDFEETLILLKDTLKGVFQIDELILSPFGIIKSKVKRKIYPQLEMQLSN